MVESNEDLEAIYGPSASYSEHKRGELITYTSAEGECRSGEIVWCQAPHGESIGVKYIVAPNVEGAFLDFVTPGQVLQVEDVTLQEQALVRCVWCGQMHPANQIDNCPMKPRQ